MKQTTPDQDRQDKRKPKQVKRQRQHEARPERREYLVPLPDAPAWKPLG